MKEKLKPFIKNEKVNIQQKYIIKELIDYTFWLNQSFSISQRVFHVINDINYIPLCKNCCIKPTKFITFKDGYRDYCSTKCSTKSVNTQERRKQTNIVKYGVDNPAKNNIIKSKTKKTNLERYGTECTFQNSIIKEKSNKTKLERYGSIRALDNKNIKNKAIKTNLERYGTEYYFQTDIFKEINKNNCISKYGVEHHVQREEIQTKIKKTNLERYGSENVSNNIEIQNKRKKTNLERYGTEFHIQKHNVEWLLKLDNYNFLEKLYKEYSVAEISKMSNVSECIIYRKLKKHNIDLKNSIFSNIEKEVVEWLKSVCDYELILNDRNIIKPKELDIYIPEKNVAIEFNGNYWHSDKFLKHDYHINKTNLCDSNGIQLLHIFESEWTEKQDIWKSVILSKLGLISNKIYARNTEIRKISSEEGYKFFNNNHLQSGLKSGVHIGLYNNNELVCCISYGKSRFEKNVIEIYRFANKLNTIVIGGFQKLLKLLPSPIISYANRRWSNGNVYLKSGFEFVHDTKPNYYYTDYNRLYSRQQFMKHKLKDKLEIFDENLTEKENMKLNGYDLIYDAGNKKFLIR